MPGDIGQETELYFLRSKEASIAVKAKLELENDLRDVVSRLISQVSIASKQTRPDINLASEDAWIPILREVFHAPQLDNLNRHQKNFPGIDLGDTENRICFQVTATTDIEKVKDTVRTFIDKKYFNSFDDLYIFILVKRQKSYSQEPIDKIIGDNNFSFSTKEHIIDPEVIVEKIGQMRLATQERMLRELKSVSGDIDIKVSSFEEDEEVPYVFASNLVSIDFPEKIYSASVDINKDAIWEAAKEVLPRMPKRKSTRSCLHLSLELSGFRNFPFVFHEGKIFTFENLEESSVFQGLIDDGTIEPVDTVELSGSEYPEYVNVFKQLLKSSIKPPLNKDNVLFSHREKIFYFMPNKEGDVERKVTWKERRKATRTVYDQQSSVKDESKVYAHRHFSFDITFTNIDEGWYGVIYPTWYYTNDRGRKHWSNQDLVASKKRLEKNHSVRDHIRFVAAYLKDLSDKSDCSVKFHGLVEFDLNSREIVDLSEEPEHEESSDAVEAV